jgi:hypothetical protein
MLTTDGEILAQNYNSVFQSSDEVRAQRFLQEGVTLTSLRP